MDNKGQVYGDEVDELKKSNRIQNFRPDFNQPEIYVAGDLGLHCAPILILFHWDIRAQSLYIYDVINSSGSSFLVYINKAWQWCTEKGCKFSTMFLPYDDEKSIPRVYTNLIDKGLDIVSLPYEKKSADILTCRYLFPKIYFNNTDSVAGLIRSLDLYSYEYDERYAKFLRSTKADVHSDVCDAFRYVCSSTSYLNKIAC